MKKISVWAVKRSSDTIEMAIAERPPIPAVSGSYRHGFNVFSNYVPVCDQNIVKSMKLIFGKPRRFEFVAMDGGGFVLKPWREEK